MTGFDTEDLVNADPVANVTIKAADDRRQLAAFMGMSVVAMLRIATYTPTITGPFARIGLRVADALAEPGDDDLSEFSIADLVRPIDVLDELRDEEVMMEVTGRDPSMDTMLGIRFPRVGGDPRPGKRLRLRVKLYGGKAPFVHLPSRNATIAANGVLCMLEQIAHDRPREDTQHIAAVCKRLFELHRDDCGEDKPLSFSEGTTLYRIAEALASSDDPAAFGRETATTDD